MVDKGDFSAVQSGSETELQTIFPEYPHLDLPINLTGLCQSQNARHTLLRQRESKALNLVHYWSFNEV